jgi:hypothetical protein
MATINHGEYISPELSETLKKYVTRQDLSEVHTETGVSASTLNQIRHMQNVVTERSTEALSRLLQRAYKNASASEKEAKRGKKSLQLFLECI